MSEIMRTVYREELAERFYRERYGINICAYNQIIRQSLENLYFRGRILPASLLYKKFEECGIVLRENSLHRIRFSALVAKVAPEPPLLTHYGVRAWYLMQQNGFDAEDLAFMAKFFPEQMARMYPSLWKACLLHFKQKHLPDYVSIELFDSDECIFQQDCERSKGNGCAALTV